MKNIDVLLSSPLPVMVSVIIAVGCLSVYYYYVIPKLEELRKATSKNDELQGKLDTRDGTDFELLKQQFARFEQLLTSVQRDMVNPDHARQMQDVLTRVTEQVSANEVNRKAAQQELIAALKAIETAQTHSRSQLDELLRQMQGVNDKQSQIVGALLGMGKLQERNRGL